jgi:ribonuclease M5
MIFFKLTGDNKAKERRDTLGKELGIGYCNTAQFITRLNNYGISKEEFVEALKRIDI